MIIHIIFSVLYLLFLFERGFFQVKAMIVSGEARKIRTEKRNRLIMIPLFLLGQVWVIGSLIYIARPELLAWSHVPLPLWIKWAGLVIIVAGMALEFATQLFLGRNYSTTLHIQEKQSLVTSGPFRFMRHPMYTALFTVGLGLGLMSTNWYFLLPFIATGIVVFQRVNKEEAAMIEKFGEEYVQYSRKTGRFLPRLVKRKEKNQR